MWQAKYKPRNHVPFTIITACSGASAITLLVTRWYLAAQNKKREQEQPDDTYDGVYIQVTDEDGKPVEKRVDKVSRVLSGGCSCC
jgi:ACS family allantoate permease-like MFS transporter